MRCIACLLDLIFINIFPHLGSKPREKKTDSVVKIVKKFSSISFIGISCCYTVGEEGLKRDGHLKV